MEERCCKVTKGQREEPKSQIVIQALKIFFITPSQSFNILVSLFVSHVDDFFLMVNSTIDHFNDQRYKK